MTRNLQDTKRSLPLALLAIVLLLYPSGSSARELMPYPAFATDKTPYVNAISQTRPPQAGPADITGLTVPHHMLAADMIARGYHAVANGRYDRIIILSPDHFFKSTKPFAITKRSFETLFGLVETDREAVEQLLLHTDLFESSDLFAKDHGLRVHFPFIAHFFKGVEIIPIAVSIHSKRADWDRALPILLPLIADKTLIIQSTDFSHYLPAFEAHLRDQETINLMAANDSDAIARLHQPSHMDSLGAQYLQMKLQEHRFRARPIILINRNSQSYSKERLERTTSYVVATYHKGNPAAPKFSDGQVFYFAGDTLLGRHFTKLLADERIADLLVAKILALTGGKPLIVNLEGVILDEIPSQLRLDAMTIPAELGIPLLKRLNIVAVSLANNHSMDLGEVAFTTMVEHLKKAGIKTLLHGSVTDLGPFRLAALRDLSNTSAQQTNLITKKDMQKLCRSNGAPPLFAFMHWGKEGHITGGPRETRLAKELHQCAVSAAIGVHSHKASPDLSTLSGGQMQTLYSLGNFIFDQHQDIASGSLLEVRFFKQGTFFSRLIPLPNLYDLALQNR